jgi:hypothetical protein
MNDDLLASVREDILKEDAKHRPWTPKGLDRTWEVQAGLAGAVTGAVAGLLWGSHMGLAGPWGAIAGTIPCAIVGGVVGYFTCAKVGSQFYRDIQQPSPRPSSVTRQVSETKHAPLSASDVCGACGAAKSSWWNETAGCCAKCGAVDGS